MKISSTDKLLIAIVIGVIALVAVAFALVLTQPKPAYRADDTAEGALHNYLFALSQDDTERAYIYLSSNLRGRPKTLDDFKRQVQNAPYRFDPYDSSTTWQIGETRVKGDETTVEVIVTRFYGNTLFGSSQSQEQHDFTLHQDQGAWKISGADSYWFWLDCWEQTKGCN